MTERPFTGPHPALGARQSAFALSFACLFLCLARPVSAADSPLLSPQSASTSQSQPSASPDRLRLSTSITLSPAQKELLALLAEADQLYLTEKYEAAGTKGLDAIGRGAQPSDDLRWKIANSLAWTGRLNESYGQYALLLNGPYDGQARLALANAERWQGRADLARPLYSQVLALDPSNTGAREGLENGERELRPSTTVSFSGSKDSNDMQRMALTVAHRWRDETGNKIYEVETRGMRDQINPANLRVQSSDVTLRFQPLDVQFQPRAYVNFQATPRASAFAGVRLKLGEGPTNLYLDRLNWGVVAVSARAMDAGLSAYHAGIESTYGFGLGQLYGRASVYKVSDSNTVLTTSLKFTPAWRPLGPGIKAYVTTDTRDVRFNTPNYWSPAIGSGTASVGLLGEWSHQDWFFYTAGQIGHPMYGESGTNWSASAAAKRWLSKDYALGFNLWGLSSRRDGANYRAKSATVNLEKLW